MLFIKLHHASTNLYTNLTYFSMDSRHLGALSCSVSRIILIFCSFYLLLSSHILITSATHTIYYLCNHHVV